MGEKTSNTGKESEGAENKEGREINGKKQKGINMKRGNYNDGET